MASNLLVMKPRQSRPGSFSEIVVSQERLRRAAELQVLEAQIVSERRDLLLGIEKEISAGGQVEPGEYTFYKEVGAVGRSKASPDSALRQMK